MNVYVVAAAVLVVVAIATGQTGKKSGITPVWIIN